MMEKGLQYKLEQLKLKTEKLNFKLLRKLGVIDYVIYSFVNTSAVIERLCSLIILSSCS